MDITTSTKQNATIHTLFGRLDYSAREIFTSTIHESDNSETHDIILDLEAVTFIDSSGLGLIHKCITEAKAQHVNVTLVNPKDQIYSILELCNMAQYVSSSDEPLPHEQSASATVKHNPHVLTRDALSIIE
ncbi:STAS domain-containing protein [Nitrospira sp. M1]